MFKFDIILSMDILKTFEIFLSAPLSVIHKRNIKIMHIETNIFAQKLPLDINLNDSDIQLTVYNNQKVYKLLSSVIYKRRHKDENNKSEIHN